MDLTAPVIVNNVSISQKKNIHDIVKIFEFYIEYLLAKLKEIKMCLFITFLIAYAF